MIDFNDPIGREFLSLVERLKYERWLGNEVTALLEREFNRLVDLLVSSKYRDLTVSQRQRAAQFFREVAKRYGEMYGDVTKLHVDQMRAYAVVESELARDTVNAALSASGLRTVIGPALPRAYLESIAKLPIQGLTVGEWFDAQAQRMTVATKRIIQQGLVEGKGPLQIASRIVASDKAQGPVLLRQAQNEARIVSRTVVNAVQNDAQFEQMRNLPRSVSDRYVFRATLDKRTTDICRAADSRVFRYDDPKKLLPPLHVSCRSSISPVLLGVGESITDQTAPRTMRTYEGWLKEQSVTDQNSILGRGRADLWRSGKMSLADTIDSDTRVIPLRELRERLQFAGV